MTQRSPVMRYAIALGSNRPLSRRLDPDALVRAAMQALDEGPLTLIACSRSLRTAPLGPSARQFVNAAALVDTQLMPRALLAHLKGMERRFGRRAGRRWGARSLDLDIILWSGGLWRERRLRIPHSAWRTRAFVLTPLADIAPRWRDPLSGLTVAQLHARLDRPIPVDP